MGSRLDDLRAQLPKGGLARAGVILSLLLGGAIAVGLTALILIYLLASRC